MGQAVSELVEPLGFLPRNPELRLVVTRLCEAVGASFDSRVDTNRDGRFHRLGRRQLLKQAELSLGLNVDEQYASREGGLQLVHPLPDSTEHNVPTLESGASRPVQFADRDHVDARAQTAHQAEDGQVVVRLC